MDDSWKYILDLFRIAPPSQQTIFYSYIILIVVVITIFTIQIILHFRRKKKRLQREWKLFYRLAEARDLSVLEVEVLTKLAQKFAPKAPQNVVDSIIRYDVLVKKFMTSFVQWDEEIDKEEARASFESAREKFFLKYLELSEHIQTTRSIPQAQSVRISVPSEFGKKYINAFVEENTSEYFTLISKEFEKLTFVFQKGEEYEGYFWRQGDAGYQFPLIVKIQKDKITVVFEHTDKIKRKQRRHFYRVNTKISARIYTLNEEDKKSLSEGGKFKKFSRPGNFLGIVVSISGGGISFFTENPSLKFDDIIWMELLMKPEEKISDIYGRIVRIKDLERRFKVFVEFIMVSDQGREDIIRYVSHIQREWKKSNDGD
ncbi:flagellar brake protein [candidate division KSB1 bacterium]